MLHPDVTYRYPGRTSTPFIPQGSRIDAYESDETSSEGSEPEPPPPRSSHRRAASVQPPVTGRIDDVLRPLTPPGRAAFGPSGSRPREPLSNPLPAPPRDLYEMTPYKSLLTLPQTTALLTASYGTAQQQNAAPSAAAATTLVIPPGGQGHAQVIPAEVMAQQQQQQAQQGSVKSSSSRKKKGMSGLFRALSGKKKDRPQSGPAAPPIQGQVIQAQPAKVQFVPVFVDGQKKPGSESTPVASTSNPNNSKIRFTS